MLLHKSRPATGISPRIRYIEMIGNRDQSIGGGTVTAAICRLDTSRIDTLDRQLEELELVIVALAGNAYYRMQRYLHVGQLFRFLVEEESDDAA